MLLFKFILSKRMINNLWGSYILQNPKFINIVSILFCNFIFEFNILSCVWSKIIGRQDKSTGRPLVVCCLLKLRIFFDNMDYLFRFSFSRISFQAFLKSINPLLILSTNCSFLAWLALIKFLTTKNDGY